jgi:hypothetical protein
MLYLISRKRKSIEKGWTIRTFEFLQAQYLNTLRYN